MMVSLLPRAQRDLMFIQDLPQLLRGLVDGFSQHLVKGPDVGTQLFLKRLRGIGYPYQKGYYGLM
jgi:hypothetical protein